MNVLILYSKILPSELRLAEFLKERGCYVFMKEFTDKSADSLAGIKITAVINRVYSRDVAKKASLYSKLLSLIAKWEKKDVEVINGYTATLCDLNKHALFKKLNAANVPTPATYAFKNMSEAQGIFEALSEGAYVIKPTCGGCAEHVSRALTKDRLLKLAKETLVSAQKRHYQLGFVIQPFIKSSLDVQYRVQMVGDVFVCCHTRTMELSGEGEPWLASASQGSKIGYISRDQMPEDMLDVCREAVNATDCLVAGIDLLVDEQNQSRIIELNATPFLHAQNIHPKYNEQEVFKQIYLHLRVTEHKLNKLYLETRCVSE